MSVQIRGSAVQTAFANTRSPTVSLPTGTVENDLLIAVVDEIHGNTMSVPSGWTQVGNQLGLAGDASVIVLRKAASAADVAAGNVTLTNVAPNATDDGGVALFAFYGHSDSAPIDYVAETDHGIQTAVTGPACVPTVANCLILHLTLCDPLDTSYTGTKDSSPDTTVLLNSCLADQYLLAQSFQNTGTASVTIEASVLTSDTYYTFAIAIAPAVSAYSGPVFVRSSVRPN